MNNKDEKMREQIIFAMLEEFPILKKKIRAYLEKGSEK
jgi:hypothetical protein